MGPAVRNTGVSKTDHIPSLGDFEGVNESKPRYVDRMY